jgi:nicotinamidase-related amidase
MVELSQLRAPRRGTRQADADAGHLNRLEPRAALLLVDVQEATTRLPAVSWAESVVFQCARLADSFRERGRPVFLARTLNPGGLDPRSDVPTPRPALSARGNDVRPELAPQASEIVTKYQRDAFVETDLDDRLRARGITQIVLGGIATSLAVESTARHAFALDYELIFAVEAMTDMHADAHRNSLERIFPRIGRVHPVEGILHALLPG